MGNSMAHPIYHSESGDVAAVIAAAVSLVGCGDLSVGAVVYLDAGLDRVEAVLRARELFPQASFSGGGSHFRGADLPGGVSELAGLLPMTLTVEEPVSGDLVERAATVLREVSWGQISWMALSWPAVPGLGLPEERGRTGVQACFHVNAEGAPAVGHTVYAHVDPVEGERAEHLARQIGLKVVGPPEHGW